ncbi:class A beta-lactamase-related serine hydrolase [Corynebacterium sp. CCM 9185]|uniref:Serine hydrolase n=1 Tax=Corynebacterium marambiense TaxID=2765364 RepID=A0ABS0VRT2_9CORY|nr:serine hydrolase [Corynebacterium marambiense]MBI8999474.1 serine hydrolase [Corynebacterium marambiense]MCK7662312.1 class A beta-lactamase-related serine hydrolase [Corynebacterium marambiense]
MSLRHASRPLTAAILSGVLGLAACAPTPPEDGGDTARHITTACRHGDTDLSESSGWVAHLAAHPDDSAVVIIPDATAPDGPDTVRKNTDTPLDIASAAKIIHLLAYADAVTDGTIDPDTPVPVSEWESFYLPLDGGAHAAALTRLGVDKREPAPGVAVATDPDATVTFDDLVSAIIIESDNAAADWLTDTLGAPALATAATRAGWDNPHIPNYLGSLLAVLDPDGADDPGAASRRYREDPEWADAILHRAPAGYSEQRDILRGTAMATAGDLAAVYTRLASGDHGPAGDIARRHLEHTPAPGYTAIGHKGGSLPGALADAMEIRREDGTPAVAVLISTAIPEADYTDALAAFAWQDLMLQAVDSHDIREQLTCGE